MADAAAPGARGGPSSSSSGCRGGRGCGLALGRLVRKLRRQSRMLVCTAGARHGHGHAASSSSSARCHQYDPLSYARNFDLGTALDGSEGYYSFASRFVLAAAPRAAAAVETSRRGQIEAW
ncbi:uncharacterized protein LOC120671572 [Panicum virgatum]|uniref:Uncharacterized protein n=1 Tax=Panicum virgatum TaxID=38727 RepID=A0A8T0TIJ7_PANVG|nr:uncharacterized protein LOC120671572 [Panicum virgatum]KAG2607829.1 hypothetical protein PVAP13_4NG275222 [Panicum virgatum]